MSGISYTMPRFQAIDQNGRPMVGATLYTYKNKTTTPHPTWKDKDQTTYNTNPIVLDARGEAVVWLDPEQVYTFVLRDWFGVLVWSQDDVVGAASGLDIQAVIDRLADTEDGNGAAMVGIMSPSGDASTVEKEIEKLDQETPVSAYSVSAGMLQTGPLIVDIGRKLKNTGEANDSAYNNNVFQEALSGVPNGAEIEFPARGLITFDGGLEVTSSGLSLRGKNARGTYDRIQLKFLDSEIDSILVKGHGFTVTGLVFQGASNTTERGSDVLQDCISFEVPNTNIDSNIIDCAFAYYRDGVTVKNNAGRNVNFVNCLFSNSQVGFSYRHLGGVDVRGFEFHACRFHSVGKPSDDLSSCIYGDPSANAQELVVMGCVADDSSMFYRGFFSRTMISGLEASIMSRGLIKSSSYGHSISASRCPLILENVYFGLGSNAAGSESCIELDSMSPVLNSIFIAGARGHGIHLKSRAIDCAISNVNINNAGQAEDDTFSGFYLDANTGRILFGGANSYAQDLLVVVENKAKYSLYIGDNASANFFSPINSKSPSGVYPYYISDLSGKVSGVLPIGANPMVAHRNSPPISGKWSRGDVVYNTVPSPSGYLGWVCTTSGTPGTWKGFGAIEA